MYVPEQNVAPMRIEDEIAGYLDRQESRFCKAWNASQPLYAGACLVAKLKRRVLMSR
jgi:hypothetical protein